MPRVTRRSLGRLLLSFAATSTARAAAELPLPAGKRVLTISGSITKTNLGETAAFDLTTLESLG